MCIRDSALTEAMGKYWIEECVGSPALATYKNCWVRQSEYRFNGLGKVSYFDSRKLMGLREGLEYIVKHVRYGLPPLGYGRKLRKGEVPQVELVPSRGAPVSYTHLGVYKRQCQRRPSPQMAGPLLRAIPRSMHQAGQRGQSEAGGLGGCHGERRPSPPARWPRQ